VSRVDSGINPPTFIEFPKHNYAKILCFIRGQCIICSNSHSLPAPGRKLCDHAGLSVGHSVCVQDYYDNDQRISLKLGVMN